MMGRKGPTIHTRGRSKLVVFNVQGTLLDCSLLADPNPNSKIRPTTKTTLRRIVLRLWLKPFLSRCFIHFAVAFWGSKSISFMEDVVPSMMDGSLQGPNSKPLFEWSSKQCEFFDGGDGEGTSWGKNLPKVYAMWPQYNAENKIIVDNKLCRVGCNPLANVIVNIPFYVTEISKLSDDKDYLKLFLWPLLEAWHACPDVAGFHSKYPLVLKKWTDDINTECQ